MFEDDHDIWRWFAHKRLDSQGELSSSRTYNIIARPPQLRIFSDASKRAVGGYCVETGWFYRYDLSIKERSLVGSSESVVGVSDTISDTIINTLELPGIFVGA